MFRLAYRLARLLILINSIILILIQTWSLDIGYETEDEIAAQEAENATLRFYSADSYNFCQSKYPVPLFFKYVDQFLEIPLKPGVGDLLACMLLYARTVTRLANGTCTFNLSELDAHVRRGFSLKSTLNQDVKDESAVIEYIVSQIHEYALKNFALPSFYKLPLNKTSILVARRALKVPVKILTSWHQLNILPCLIHDACNNFVVFL